MGPPLPSDDADTVLHLTTAGGIVQVRIPGPIDDDASAQLQSLLGRLPESVPVVIDVGDQPRPEPAELGFLLSLARTASFAGRRVGISAPEPDLRARLAAIGVDRFASVAASCEECTAELTTGSTRTTSDATSQPQ